MGGHDTLDAVPKTFCARQLQQQQLLLSDKKLAAALRRTQAELAEQDRVCASLRQARAAGKGSCCLLPKGGDELPSLGRRFRAYGGRMLKRKINIVSEVAPIILP